MPSEEKMLTFPMCFTLIYGTAGQANKTKQTNKKRSNANGEQTRLIYCCSRSENPPYTIVHKENIYVF